MQPNRTQLTCSLSYSTESIVKAAGPSTAQSGVNNLSRLFCVALCGSAQQGPFSRVICKRLHRDEAVYPTTFRGRNGLLGAVHRVILQESREFFTTVIDLWSQKAFPWRWIYSTYSGKKKKIEKVQKTQQKNKKNVQRFCHYLNDLPCSFCLRCYNLFSKLMGSIKRFVLIDSLGQWTRGRKNTSLQKTTISVTCIYMQCVGLLAARSAPQNTDMHLFHAAPVIQGQYTEF